MREQQLEEILAEYPGDFFPERGFKLVGRQTHLSGVGRFDLLFEDRNERKWLIELKAVPLKITDTDQVLRYHEELQQRYPNDSFIPCFVAPSIAPHVRTYLDGKGLDYREITLAEFRRVASERGMSMDAEEEQPPPPTLPPDSSPPVRERWAVKDPSLWVGRWNPTRYEALFESLGFRDFKSRKKIQHPQLRLTVHVNQSGDRVGFIVYRKNEAQFDPALWEFLPPWGKKEADPRFMTVVPRVGLEEEAFRSLLS